MTDKKQENVHPPFHSEAGTIIFDKPPSTEETRRQAREDEQHEFARKQVKTNNRIAWFNGCLVLATFCTIAVGFWQGVTSQKSAGAAVDSARAAIESTYLACLSTQANQLTFAQIEKGASDAHASAVATIEQARAGIEAERAIVVFTPRNPYPYRIPGSILSIPYSFKNRGKTAATKITVRVRADMYKGTGKTLTFGNPPVAYRDVALLADGDIRETPQDGGSSPIDAVEVNDVLGNKVSIASAEAQDFIQGGSNETVFIYGDTSYEDSFGSHKSTFCFTSLRMRPGETKATPKNALICQNHVSRKDIYFGLPSINAIRTQTEVPTPIACVKP